MKSARTTQPIWGMSLYPSARKIVQQTYHLQLNIICILLHTASPGNISLRWYAEATSLPSFGVARHILCGEVMNDDCIDFSTTVYLNILKFYYK